MKRLVVLGAVLAPGLASADNTLLIGHDLHGPAREYTKAGVFIQEWGSSASVSGVASDELGQVFAVTPSFGNNVIEKLDVTNSFLSSFTATVNGNWIEDLGYLGNGDLLAGTFEGNIYRVDQTGSASLLFATDTSFTGVTFDGTSIWYTAGFFGAMVFQADLDGNVLSSFATPFGAAGIAYDTDDDTLYIGDIDSNVYHYTTTGTELGVFNTGIGPIDGLEMRSIPAPGPVLLLGLAAVAPGRRRRR